MLQDKVCFWTKGDIIDLIIEYNLLESEHDAIEFSYCLSFDDLLEFACYLFSGGWGSSRNFSALSEEEQSDDRIKRMFEYVDKLRG